MGASFLEKQLSNGLTLLGEHNPAAQSVALGFFVRTGSRDEVEVESGVSHFLEHMMFKGSSRFNALELTYALGNIGSQANAYTSDEQTVYYATVLPEYFAEMQGILCDMLRPSLDAEEFDTEKKVILEEIALYKDRPHFYLFEHAIRDYYMQHSAGNSVLGSSESITALTNQQMRDYFNRRYVPSNMVFVASGKFSWDQFCADAEKLCGNWANQNVTRETLRYQGSSVSKTYTKANLNQAHLLFINETASAQDDERYALAVLSVIIGDGTGSKLYWELVETGLAESAGASHDSKDGTGSLLVTASTAPENLERVSEIIRTVLSNANDYSDAELEQAKAKLASRIVLSGELPMGRLVALGGDWLYLKRVETLSEVLYRLKKIDRKAIQQALEKFPLKQLAEFRLVSA